MPYPDDWEIDVVCNDNDWVKLLSDDNQLGKTQTAFTVMNIPCDIKDGCSPSTMPARHTYIRARGFFELLHIGGPRHTLTHELGHIIAGANEIAAEVWADEWEIQYARLHPLANGLETIK